jgi:ferric-dicitrate binding protein FerR (iron transport regulator)
MGTTFNVFARDSQLKVYCQTGKVKVSANGSVILTPGMTSVLQKGRTFKTSLCQDIHEFSWQQGEFWYHNAPFSQVVEELERQFNVTITYPKDTERFYTGYFNRKSMDQALKNVFEPMQIAYHIHKNEP